ncbi:MAG: hypothetical protein ACREX9_15090 [Gammaproteobacteria bacterium]
MLIAHGTDSGTQLETGCQSRKIIDNEAQAAQIAANRPVKDNAQAR